MTINNDAAEVLRTADEGEHEPAYTDPVGEWLPRDLYAADRLVARYRRIELDLLQGIALFDRRIRDLQDARDEWARGAQVKLTWIEQTLRLFHRARLLEDPSATTIVLPSGKLSSSAAQPKWTYPDEAAFIAWAREHRPDLLRLPPPPEHAPAKDVVKKTLAVAPDGAVVDPATGEVVPGVIVTPGGDDDGEGRGLGRTFKIA